MTGADELYESALVTWRSNLEASLRSEQGWLALAGLFWLNEGTNRVGSKAGSEVLLPEEIAPPFVAEFCLRDNEVKVEVAHSELAVNAAPPSAKALQDDMQSSPDLVTFGRLTMVIIRRAGRVGVRMWDRDRPARATFSGRRWAPIDPGYRLEASFVPYDPPKPIQIVNIIGDSEEKQLVGYLQFTISGQQHQLDVQAGPKGGFSIHFRDATSGSETYPSGRFLYTDAPQNGTVVLDFNRAYNPPCAFTLYATCPLPPKQNTLSVAIHAGELAPLDEAQP